MDASALLSGIGAGAAFVLAFAAFSWPVRLRQALYLLAASGVVAAAGRFALAIVAWLRPDSPVNSYDFTVFYHAAEAARAQAPLYDLPGIRRDPGAIVVYRHAPIGAVLFIPWSFLPYPLALNCWRLLNAAIYLAAFGLLLRSFRLSHRAPLALGLAILWLVCAPARESLGLGQWDALFLALSVVALDLLTRHRDRDGLAGAALALPLLLKFYPALILLAPLLARRYRVVAGTVVAGLALMLVGLLVAGFANTWTFVAEVLPAVGGGTLYAENQTIYALIGRILASDLPGNGVGARYPTVVTAVLADGLGLMLVALTVLVIWRRTRRDAIDPLSFVLPIPAALLVVPTAWLHYETWALFPLVVLALARDGGSWTTLVAFTLAALVIPFGTERDIWSHPARDGVVRLLLTYKAYGLAALWIGLALTGWRPRPARPPRFVLMRPAPSHWFRCA